MFNIIKKADIVLFIVLLLAGLGLSWLSIADSITGQKAVISVDGQPFGTYSLSENRTIKVAQDGHLNKINIKDGQVQMSSSNCRNKVCVRDGFIGKTNQSLVCLPNKVMVEITGGEEDYDAISN